MENWEFADPPNYAVIANKNALANDGWIAYVSHDIDDGGWQFHIDEANVSDSDICVVSLRNVVQKDPSVALLFDLPVGWYAWRKGKDLPWQRAPIS